MMSKGFFSNTTRAFSFSIGVGIFVIELLLTLEGNSTGWLLIMSAFMAGLPIGMYLQEIEAADHI